MNYIEEYLHDNKFEKRLKYLTRKLKNKKIIIYGTGILFQTIVRDYDLSGLNIIGISDAKYSLNDEGNEEFGFRIIPVEKISNYNPDFILLGLHHYSNAAKELSDRIKPCTIIPIIPEKFKLFEVQKLIQKNIKKVRILGLTFSLPLTNNEKILYYLEQANPYPNLDLQPARNLKLHMAQIAADDSARYVMKHMLKVPAFDNRLKLLSYALKQVQTEGEYLEFGVFNGKTINHISTERPFNTIYGFDSFEGLPESWTQHYKKGYFKVDNLPEVNKNVKLIKGWFEDTLPNFIKEKGDFKVAFIHSDSDLYSSTKTTLDNLKGRIQKGTVIVFDEYLNYPGWEENEFKAFQEFIQETGLKYEYIGYVFNAKQTAVRIL